MRCCVCVGGGVRGRPKCIKAAGMNKETNHLGREPPALAVSADTTWFRDEPPN